MKKTVVFEVNDTLLTDLCRTKTDMMEWYQELAGEKVKLQSRWNMLERIERLLEIYKEVTDHEEKI